MDTQLSKYDINNVSSFLNGQYTNWVTSRRRLFLEPSLLVRWYSADEAQYENLMEYRTNCRDTFQQHTITCLSIIRDNGKCDDIMFQPLQAENTHGLPTHVTVLTCDVPRQVMKHIDDFILAGKRKSDVEKYVYALFKVCLTVGQFNELVSDLVPLLGARAEYTHSGHVSLRAKLARLTGRERYALEYPLLPGGIPVEGPHSYDSMRADRWKQSTRQIMKDLIRINYVTKQKKGRVNFSIAVG